MDLEKATRLRGDSDGFLKMGIEGRRFGSNLSTKTDCLRKEGTCMGKKDIMVLVRFCGVVLGGIALFSDLKSEESFIRQFISALKS